MTKWLPLLFACAFLASCDGTTVGDEIPDENGSTTDENGSTSDGSTNTDDPAYDGTAPDYQQWPDGATPDDQQWPDGQVADDEQPDGGETPDEGGEEDDPLRLYKSGSRIRARFGETPDGAKQFFGWYDNQIGTDCAFAQTAEGLYRCIPTPILYASYYANSSCTTPLFMVAVGCGAVASWGVTYDECARPGHVFQVGSVYGGGTGYVRSGGNCVSLDLSTYAGIYTFYNAGQEYPLSSFQTMNISTE